MRISDWSSDVCSSDLAFELLLDPFFYAARASFCLFELCLVIERLRFATWTNHPGIADLHDPSNVTVIVKRSEEHTSELQSLMRISYAVFCLKKKQNNKI